jgi:hypothetical protein
MSEEAIVTAIVGLIAVGIAGMITSTVASQSFFGRLRDRFPDRWRALGEPSGKLFKGYDRVHQADVTKFLWRREYASLADQELSRFGNRAIAGILVFIGSIVVTILLPIAGAHRTDFNPSVNLFVVGMGAVGLWLAAVIWLFHRLKTCHPAKYTEMGEPGFFLNNNWRTSRALLKFIYTRGHSSLGDRPLSVVSDLMALYLPAVLWFIFRFSPHYYSRG